MNPDRARIRFLSSCSYSWETVCGYCHETEHVGPAARFACART